MSWRIRDSMGQPRSAVAARREQSAGSHRAIADFIVVTELVLVRNQWGQCPDGSVATCLTLSGHHMPGAVAQDELAVGAAGGAAGEVRGHGRRLVRPLLHAEAGAREGAQPRSFR